ncbi:MAG: LOG family protein [Fibrobacteria bacterium]|nr:LOG family protein [Fibrobacteria bacterium]
MAKQKLPIQAFDNKKFLHSHKGRILRVMAEFLEPENRFEKYDVQDTLAFFGSARTVPLEKSKRQLAALKRKKVVDKKALKRAKMDYEMSMYYEDAVLLSQKLAQWTKDTCGGFAISSGGGPGMMEAANKGAKLGGVPSIGLNINLPFEQAPNPYISEELNFEFYYFFIRKYWFLYTAKAIIAFPGGFGTLDEMMEVLTLVQTKKVEKDMAIVLYGEKYWKNVINFDYLVDSGTIDEADLELFHFSKTVDDAFIYIVSKLEKLIEKRRKNDLLRYRRLIVED